MSLVFRSALVGCCYDQPLPFFAEKKKKTVIVRSQKDKTNKCIVDDVNQLQTQAHKHKRYSERTHFPIESAALLSQRKGKDWFQANAKEKNINQCFLLFHNFLVEHLVTCTRHMTPRTIGLSPSRLFASLI